LPFGAPASAFLGILSRRGIPPLLRSAYRAITGRTPTGFPRFAHTRCGRGGRPLNPRTSGVLATDGVVSGRRSPPPPAARPYHPGVRPVVPRLSMTRHHRGFTHVRPSGLPLARLLPRTEQGPLGFLPELRTPTSRTCRRTSERGPISNTDQELRTRHSRPPICESTRHARPRASTPPATCAIR